MGDKEFNVAARAASSVLGATAAAAAPGLLGATTGVRRLMVTHDTDPGDAALY